MSSTHHGEWETTDHRQVDPSAEVLAAGSVLFRVHSHRFGPADYNPGKAPATPATRFAFFVSPPVPVLYAATTAEAAISETILRDVPVDGGRIDVDLVQPKIHSPVISTRDLRFKGPGPADPPARPAQRGHHRPVSADLHHPPRAPVAPPSV